MLHSEPNARKYLLESRDANFRQKKALVPAIYTMIDKCVLFHEYRKYIVSIVQLNSNSNINGN